jgi:transposase
MKTSHSPTLEAQQAPDTRTVEDLRKENEYLRAEVAYLKKLDALVRAKKQAAPSKRKR